MLRLLIPGSVAVALSVLLMSCSASPTVPGADPGSSGDSGFGSSGDSNVVADALFGTTANVTDGVVVVDLRVVVSDEASADWYAPFGYVETAATITVSGLTTTLFINEERQCEFHGGYPVEGGVSYDAWCGDDYLAQYTLGEAVAGGATSIDEAGWPTGLPHLESAFTVELEQEYATGQIDFAISYDGSWDDAKGGLDEWGFVNLLPFDSDDPADDRHIAFGEFEDFRVNVDFFDQSQGPNGFISFIPN